MSKILSMGNDYRNISVIFYVVIIKLSPQNLMCVLYLQHIPIQTSQISCLQQSSMADDNYWQVGIAMSSDSCRGVEPSK